VEAVSGAPPQQKVTPSESDILPSTCRPPCNDYAFGEKTAVDGGGGRRQKNGHFSSEIKAVDGSTGRYPEIAPSSQIPAISAPSVDDHLEPDFLGRTSVREVPPDRRPALGPPGDSLDDLRLPRPTSPARRRRGIG